MNLSRFLSILIISPTLIEAYYSKTIGFLYNYDAVCSYPFDEFTIDSILCDSVSNNPIIVEGVNDYETNADGSADECHFGDHMEIEGQVTTVEAVSRYFDIYVHLCYKTAAATTQSSSSSSSGEKCSSFQTSLDLGYHQEEEDRRTLTNYDETVYDNHEYRNENYYEYLPEGTYSWSATLKVPTPNFSYRSRKQLKISSDGRHCDTYCGVHSNQIAFLPIPIFP